MSLEKSSDNVIRLEFEEGLRLSRLHGLMSSAREEHKYVLSHTQDPETGADYTDYRTVQ